MDERLTHIIVRGPYCWGRGVTLSEADENARQNAPSNIRDKRKWAKAKKTAHFVPEDARVDDMGAVFWTNQDPDNPVKLAEIPL